MKKWDTWGIVIASGLLIIASWTTGSDWAMIAAAIIAGYRIAISAFQALRIKIISIDLLVIVAAVGAMFIQNYWESAAVTFLFALGGALERATISKICQALSDLVAAAPETATVLRDDQPQTVEVWELVPGDTVLIRNGEQVPVDGVIVSGNGGVDEASITGESVPADKGEGMDVFAGTWLRSGVLRVKAVGIGADTTLVKIIHRVEDAQDAKAKTQTFMEKFSRYYTPGVMVSALVVGLFTGNVELALTLLVIGCPGALVISIPVSIVAGIGRGARDGILIKGGEYLETSAKIDAVALDKTGTLTEGRPQLTDVIALYPDLGPDHPVMDEDEVLRMAARAEAGSEHPLARPILEAAAEAGLPVLGLPQHTEPVPGKGIVSTLDRHRVAVGNLALLEAENISGYDDASAAAEVERLAAEGRTPMVVACDGRVIGVVAVADRIRADAPEMVRRLHAAGVKKVVM